MASSITQAREGSLYLMCGGEKSAFDRAEPILQALGKTIRYIGKSGEAANGRPEVPPRQVKRLRPVSLWQIPRSRSHFYMRGQPERSTRSE